ncbi:FAD binding domain protein [Xylariaceae sp. FL0255]|nr:FAD binding domain protein [Xylariaceae sp. FL0255]
MFLKSSYLRVFLAAGLSLSHFWQARAASCLCCSTLASLSPGKVFFPNSSDYVSSLASYWAEQEQDMTPSCIFSPSSSQDVSVALSTVIVPQSCNFAVRGGGHASLTGASNINGGITIDLRNINSTSLSADGSTVSVGGGQIIGNVYSLLAEHELSIPAARDYTIGMGGSTLGGGLGYFGPKAGFAASSVVEYEIVLANGSLVAASAHENNDLWKALKGGGNNFGIVINFVFRTFPLGKIWAGDVLKNGSTTTIEDTANAFSSFIANPNYDFNASAFVTYGFTASEAVLLTEYTYAAPVANASVFAGLLQVPGEVLEDDTAVTTLPEFSMLSNSQSPSGLQQITFAMSFENDAEMLVNAWNILNVSTPKIQDIQGSSWGLTLEPILPSMADNSTSLGLEIPQKGLILTICSANFDLASDYAYMSNTVQQLLDDLITAAEELGIYNRFIDMNHAMAGQNPFAGYGDANWEFLQVTAKKYDPKGVFQTLEPGGFKLWPSS